MKLLGFLLAAAPATIGELADKSPEYLVAAQAAAIGAGTLSFGWVLLVIVRKYTGGVVDHRDKDSEDDEYGR